MTGERDPLALPSDPSWQIAVDGWSPDREPAVEAICALVNGYCGVRAAVEEGSAASGPGTYINGVFDAAHEATIQAAATPEHSVTAAPTSELVRAPDWSRVRVVADGVPLDLDGAELVERRRALDLSRGALVRTWRLRHDGRTTRLRSLRFASLDDRHVLGQLLAGYALLLSQHRNPVENFSTFHCASDGTSVSVHARIDPGKVCAK